MDTAEKGERRTVGFDFEITGVCLFVPRPGRHVSVLMPDTNYKECPHDHRMPHRSVIVFPKKYAVNGCTEECDGGWCVIDIGGKRVELSNGTAPTSMDLSDLYLIDRFAPDRKVKAHFGPELQAEVRLASGRCTGASCGARFRIDGRKARMPNVIHWSIDAVEPVLRLIPLGGGSPSPIQLDPAGDARIPLFVRHVPEDEVCPVSRDFAPPEKGTPAHHFFALDQLLVEHHVPVIEPVWEGDTGDAPCDTERRGGNPYTCMPGGGG